MAIKPARLGVRRVLRIRLPYWTAMTALNTHQIEQLRSLLHDRKHLLLKDLQRDAQALREESVRTHEPGADGGEQSGADHAASVSAGEMARDAEELQAIEQALDRMARNDYGTCVACGEAIPAKRLLANPIAVRCLSCQVRHERSHPGATPHSL